MNRLGLVLVVSSILGGAAWASPITYTESGQLSGTLEATSLTDAAFTFTFYGDTANIFPFVGLPGVLLNLATSNSLVISGSSGSFTDPMEVGINQVLGVVAILNEAITGGISFNDPAAVGYDLATPISFTGSAPFLSNPIGTSLGALTITGVQNLSFTASTGVSEPASTSDVPEPASMTLLGAGLLALAGLRPRRQRM